MKKMTCEICGSTEIVKNNGIFECKECGTQYSVEEARKLLGENNKSEVAREDKTVENCLTLARNAYQSSNLKEAEEYANKAIIVDPENSEAWLLKGLAAAWQSTVARSRMVEFKNGFTNAIQNAKSIDELNEIATRAAKENYSLFTATNKLIIDNFVDYPTSEKIFTYISNLEDGPLYGSLISMAYAKKVLESFKGAQTIDLSGVIRADELHSKNADYMISGGVKLWNDTYDAYSSSNGGYPSDYDLERMMEKGGLAMVLLNSAVPSEPDTVSSSKEKDIIIKACKSIIGMKNVYMNLKSYESDYSNGYKRYVLSKYINVEGKQQVAGEIRKLHETIKLCDPSYEIPEVPQPKATSGGCYVATAVYGSYDCPQVWTLRRYRDNTLSQTWYGRAFIHMYYSVSPTLVRWFGDTNWFKKLWRGKLDKMVSRLQAEGIEDTPYEDKSW